MAFIPLTYITNINKNISVGPEINIDDELLKLEKTIRFESVGSHFDFIHFFNPAYCCYKQKEMTFHGIEPLIKPNNVWIE